MPCSLYYSGKIVEKHFTYTRIRILWSTCTFQARGLQQRLPQQTPRRKTVIIVVVVVAATAAAAAAAVVVVRE